MPPRSEMNVGLEELQINVFQSERLLAQGRKDTTTMARVSVNFYYTPNYKSKIGKDVEGHIENLVAEANKVFKNSKIPVEIYSFCTQQLKIAENKRMIDNFRYSKGNIETNPHL